MEISCAGQPRISQGLPVFREITKLGRLQFLEGGVNAGDPWKSKTETKGIHDGNGNAAASCHVARARIIK